jgi:hypothetical protein
LDNNDTKSQPHQACAAAARQQDLVFRALEVFASDGSGFARPTLGVRPGAWEDGLKLRSRRRPGLLNFYVQGGLAIPAFQDEPPEEVSNQMGAVIRSLYNYRHTFCFGPRFDEKANTFNDRQGIRHRS